MGPLLLVLMWPEELQSVFKEAVKLLCFEFGLFQYEQDLIIISQKKLKITDLDNNWLMPFEQNC